MMREAVEEFEREGREVDDDRAPSWMDASFDCTMSAASSVGGGFQFQAPRNSQAGINEDSWLSAICPRVLAMSF
jgi:hypothetical protein